jgi:hypothetical protein
MSHITVQSTKIKDPNVELFNEALQHVLGQYRGGQIKDFYYDYNGQRHHVPLAVFTKQVHRGIGIKVNKETGYLEFISDDYNNQLICSRIKGQIIQTYVLMALERVLQTQLDRQTEILTVDEEPDVLLLHATEAQYAA